MAFNPFETFSVRSRTGKSVMAVLGIVVMLTFVMSTGAVGSGMDFFDQIGSLFSSKKGRGDVVAKAYGDDVRSSELDEVRRQRQVAKDYLGRALDASYTEWAKDLEADVKAGRLAGEVKDVVGRFVTLRLKTDADRGAYGNYLGQFSDFQRFGPDVQKFAEAWRKAREKPDSDEAKAMDAVATIMAHDVSRSPMFLVPLDTESDRGVLDFLLLLKLADKLGIQLSAEGVKDLVARDTGGRLTPKDADAIVHNLRSSGRIGNVSPEWLEEALANEYRAKLALSALEGKPLVALMAREARARNLMLLSVFGVDLTSKPLPGELATDTAPPGGVTPYEFFEFYKDRCGEHTFDLLEVKAEAFLDQVKEQPTRAELNALFAKYRGEVPDPSRDRPGFKEPRKVKVEFVTLDGTAPRVTQAIPKVQAASLFLCGSGGAIAGNPVAALAEAAQPALADTLPVQEAVAKRTDFNRQPYSGLERFEFTPRDTSIYRPRPIAAALGVLAGHPDVTTVVAAAAAVHQQVERLDHQERVPQIIQPVLTAFNPTFGNALGLPALALAHAPKLPPEALYRPEALATVKKEQRQNLFQADVRQFENKMFELTKDAHPLLGKADKDKAAKARAEAQKYVAEWLKDRGLTAAATKEPVDQFSVVGNPDLKPLNDLALPEPDGTNSLSKRLFETLDPRFGGGYQVAPYQPFWFPSDPAGTALDKPNRLVWETEEVPAVAYNNLENADKLTNGDMTRRVERAWRLEKARALAKAEADRLAERVKEIAKGATTNREGVERQLRDLAAEKNLREVVLERMAVLKFQHSATQAQIEYEQPKIDKTQVLYPTPDFVGKLLELRKEPVGAVTVLPDAPRTRFYVVCMVGKTEKTVDQFREVFDKANASIGRNPLYAQYALPEERFRAMEDVILRLRADAGLELKDAFKARERKSEE